MGQVGHKNSNWRGGRSVASSGYVLVRVGAEHHLADVRGYAYEHRLVAEEAIGRRLLRGEVVHHRDGDKTNNRQGNLEVLGGVGLHMSIHHSSSRLRQPYEPNQRIECACGCGVAFMKYDASGRPRMYVSGHNMTRDRQGRFSIDVGTKEETC